MGDQQASRATMLRLQRLTFIGVDDPGLPMQHLVQMNNKNAPSSNTLDDGA
jgi:hypothetical protein